MNSQNSALNLETVYYSAPIPHNAMVLTSLALVFDRIYFPNVYLPEDGYDPEEVRREAQRLEALKDATYETGVLIGSLRILPHLSHLREFCDFTGKNGQIFGGDLDQVKNLRADLNLKLFGPYPEGWQPVFVNGCHKGLPGGGYVDFPDTLSYLANAIAFAGHRGIPIVNDTNLPVLSPDALSINPQVLASVLALKCIELALPNVPVLTPASMVAARNELAPQLRAFRASVARLAGMLNAMLGSDADAAEIQKKAEFLVRTEVAATLSDLEAEVNKPKILTLENLAFAASGVTSTVVAASTSNIPIAIATALGSLGALGIKIRKNQSEPQRSGLYYLLKARQIGRK